MILRTHLINFFVPQISYPGTLYFVLSFLWNGMRSQGVPLSIHAGFSFLVMHHLKSLRVLHAVQCALHSRHVCISYRTYYGIKLFFEVLYNDTNKIF